MMWLLAALIGCEPSTPPIAPGLSVDEIATHIRPDVKQDRKGWAVDVRQALLQTSISPDASAVCQVLAIVEQESGYQPDPAVPGLGRIARSEVESKLSMLGPLTDLGADWLLSPVPEGQSRSFGDRLEEARTERDIDRLFREIVSYHQGTVPGLQAASATLFTRKLERLNPVQTAGSMQVNVIFAQDLGRREDIPPETVRELLYTRPGGLRYGVARLFAHQADYDDPIFRFADYNAGLYASRNANLQEQLARLTGLELARDGDLMLWTDAGKPSGQDSETLRALLAWRMQYAPDLDERQIRRDIRLEKERAFEQTDTWSRLRATYTAQKGKVPAYARMPEVALSSPKMSKQRTTAWFAESVKRRYQECLARK